MTAFRFLPLGLCILVAGSTLHRSPAAKAQAPIAVNAAPKPIEATSLHNVFRIDGNLFSGSSPDDEQGYQSLANLGVKLLISVDGAKPNVDLAHKYGMRYVHLPIGYDGLPKERVAELMKVAQTAEGSVYVHCHHGKHRGPAAVAGICRTVKGWDAARAKDWLIQAGTGADYAGLYRDVEKLEQPDAAALAKVPAKLPEVADTPAEVDIMVAIDETFDRLKAAKAVGWIKIPTHPDVTPHQAAAVLWEQFREHGRTGDMAKRSQDYLKLHGEAEAAALKLKEVLGTPDSITGDKDKAFAQTSQTCAACHKQHRN